MSDNLPPPRGVGHLHLSPPPYRALLEALADADVDFWGACGSGIKVMISNQIKYKYTCLEYVDKIIETLEYWILLHTRSDSEYRVHHSWITLPERNIVTIAMEQADDPMKVGDSMIVYSIYNIIKTINNGKSNQQWLEDLKEFNFNLIDLILHYQGEAIALKFNKKYEVHFDPDDATLFYKQVRDSGIGGRYNCINEMSLSIFGENAYEDWSCFSSISYVELIGKANTCSADTGTTGRNEYENVPISITISNSTEVEEL